MSLMKKKENSMNHNQSTNYNMIKSLTKMFKLRVKTFSLGLIVVTVTSCKTTSKVMMFTEKTIPVQEVRAKRIAILPNRYPVTLQNAEVLRQSNYEKLSRLLTRKGYQVIDYNTSNQEFQASSLPLEDTKSSRDKYADLARQLDVDLLALPYYGTSFNSTGFSNSYIAVATIQFYSVEHNDFCARIDMEGIYKIQTWPALVAPAVGGIVLSLIDPVLGMVGSLSGLVLQAVIAVNGKTGHDKAFRKAFREGVDEFSISFSTSGGHNKAVKRVKDENIYAKYTIAELQTLKKAAIANSDYDKAAAIKAEIDSRQ
jgi:hypothetical protein